MIQNLRITVFVENTTRRSNLLAEHGWALWIEADGHRILFDTGQGHVLRHNARQLEIPLDTTEMVLLSHGHYDHTGGLSDVFAAAGKIDIYLHPAAIEEKYSREKTPPHRSIGMAACEVSTLDQQTRHIVWTKEPTTVVDGIHLTGEIPRQHDFEDTGGPFYRDCLCHEADPILDDQALYIETPQGIVVVLGCAHAGVVNTLDYINQLTGQKQLDTVLGGMHLVRASAQRMAATIEALKRYRVQRIGTAHCTGMRATVELWTQLPDICFECPVGTVLTFGDL